MDADDGLRLDYEQTTQFLRSLVDVRFKLLAFVPTITGAAVGLVGRPRPAAELLGVGLLGLLATLGIFIYELRNTQLHDALVRRAAELERQLGLRSALGASGPGGLFGELPVRAVRLLGVLPVGQDRGLALVYAAALAGWTYLAAWGALGAVELGEARGTGAAIGVAVGLLVLAEVERIHRSSAEEGSRPARRPPPA
jgi:hypothetical protein